MVSEQNVRTMPVCIPYFSDYDLCFVFIVKLIYMSMEIISLKLTLRPAMKTSVTPFEFLVDVEANEYLKPYPHL